MLLAWQKNWGCLLAHPIPPTLDLCPEKIETTVILSNEIQRLPHLQRFGVTFTWACLVELLSRGHITLWILNKGAYNNYVDKTLIIFHPINLVVDNFTLDLDKNRNFLNHLPTSSCPRSYRMPTIRQSLFNCAWCIRIILRSYRIKLHHGVIFLLMEISVL